MTRIRGYRLGDRYWLENAPEEAEPICVELGKDVRLSKTQMKVLMLYRGFEEYGKTLGEALRVGCCTILEGEPAPEFYDPIVPQAEPVLG